MDAVTTPLTWWTAASTWQWNSAAAVLIVCLGGSYGLAWRRAGSGSSRRCLASFAAGLTVLGVAEFSAVATYAGVLFWVRALQVLLLLFVSPFLLALGRPVATLHSALDASARRRVDLLLHSRPARVLVHPTTTSAAMMATPWLLYLTSWYRAALVDAAVGTITTLTLLAVGFVYYYARLQADPVPRRYSPGVSLLITVAESLTDGLLGLVLWLGPVIATDYYKAVGRQWGPSIRVDQSIGAGVLWLIGDLFGLVFVAVLMRSFAADERTKARRVDAVLDVAASGAPVDAPESFPSPEDFVASSTLWWETDAQLRERMLRRRG
jgi:cytochrome c oxidase assembly factor CtaG